MKRGGRRLIHIRWICIDGRWSLQARFITEAQIGTIPHASSSRYAQEQAFAAHDGHRTMQSYSCSRWGCRCSPYATCRLPKWGHAVTLCVALTGLAPAPYLQEWSMLSPVVLLALPSLIPNRHACTITRHIRSLHHGRPFIPTSITKYGSRLPPVLGVCLRHA